jgi:hypothetical protein
VAIVAGVVAAADVAAVNNSNFRMKNLVTYGENPLYELQGFFSID